MFVPAKRNLFSAMLEGAGQENFSTLFESNGVKIERIVSHSASSPPGFWFDQAHLEWVIVLKGTAVLQFIDGKEVTLSEGDYLLIPKHEKHRVERTSEEVIWLAVHLPDA